MSVLYWSDFFYPHIGGIETFGGRLLPALRARGHEIVVITSRPDDTDADEGMCEGVRLCWVPFKEALAGRDHARVMAIRRRIADIKRELRPTLVHLNDLQCSLFFHLHTASAHRAALLMTVHGFDPRPEQLPLIRRALAAAAWVATVSHAVLDEVRGSEPSIAPRSSVILNSLPAPAVQPTPLDLDAPRLLCLGRLHRDKGFDLAIEAFARIGRRLPSARLLLAGDGPQRPALAALAGELGVGARVDFLGFVDPDAVPDLLNRAALVLMPSSYEAFGLVALQAAQMGRPVVASRLGGLREVVADGETGVLVHPRDAAGFAAAAESILLDPATATRMGRAARLRAATAFKWEEHVDHYDALYRRLQAT